MKCHSCRQQAEEKEASESHLIRREEKRGLGLCAAAAGNQPQRGAPIQAACPPPESTLPVPGRLGSEIRRVELRQCSRSHGSQSASDSLPSAFLTQAGVSDKWTCSISKDLTNIYMYTNIQKLRALTYLTC